MWLISIHSGITFHSVLREMKEYVDVAVGRHGYAGPAIVKAGEYIVVGY